MSEDKSNLLKRRQPIEISSIDPNYTPRIRVPIIPRTPPPYTTIAAVVLLFFGIFFLTFGLVVFYTHLWTHGKDRAIALIVLGSISKNFFSFFSNTSPSFFK